MISTDDRIATLERDLADLRVLVEDLRRRPGRPRKKRAVHFRANAARDSWILQKRAAGLTWKQIHQELIRIGPAKGWAVPFTFKAMYEAWARDGQRQLELRRQQPEHQRHAA
jgi:hypothetical protein